MTTDRMVGVAMKRLPRQRYMTLILIDTCPDCKQDYEATPGCVRCKRCARRIVDREHPDGVAGPPRRKYKS